MKVEKNIAAIIAFASCFMAAASLSAQTTTGKFTVNMSHGPVVIEIGRKGMGKQEISNSEQNGSDQKDANQNDSAQKGVTPKSSEQKDTTPDGSAKRDVTLNGSVQKDTTPDGSAKRDVTLNGSVQKDATPDGSAKKDVTLNDSAQKDTTPDGSTKKDVTPNGSGQKKDDSKPKDGIYYDENAKPSQSQSGIIYDANNKTLTYGKHTYKFVKIGNCTFSMGATTEQEGESETSESPRHRVTLFSYWLGATEVPQWLWTAVMNNNPSSNVGEDNPVENVSWNECKEFTEKLSQLAGRKFGMPTEAQMELAMRDGKNDNENKYGVEGNLDDIAWYSANSDGRTHPVGLKTPHGVGLYDIIGNVGEWCSDWYAPYNAREEQSPAGPESGAKKVFRSGTFKSTAKDCRTSSRFAEDPDKKSPHIGLRLTL